MSAKSQLWTSSGFWVGVEGGGALIAEFDALRGKGRWGRNSTVKTVCLLRKLNGPPNGVAPNPRTLKPLSNAFLSIAARNSSFSSNLHLLIILFLYRIVIYLLSVHLSWINSCSLMAGLHLHPSRTLFVPPMAACSRLCKFSKIQSNLLLWFSIFLFVYLKISKFIVLQFNIGTWIQEYHPLYSKVW